MNKFALMLKAAEAIQSVAAEAERAAADDGKIDKEEVLEIVTSAIMAFLTG